MRALAFTVLTVMTLSSWPTTSAQSSGLVELGVTVVNGETHEPIKGADVHLQLGDDRPTGPQSSFIRVIAGQADAARAEFPAFATGWYSVSAQKTGWGVGSFGQQFPGGLADEVDLTTPGHREIDVPLWPPSSLSGIVTDEDGRPVSGVSVKLLFSLLGIPGWRTSIAQVESSGAGGTYRFDPLPPGHYLVAVTPLAVPTRGDVPLNGAFLPQLYPAARVQSEAQVVEIGAGEQRVLSLNVWSHNLDTISGVVRSPSGDGIKTSLKLRPVVGTEAGLDDLAVETSSGDNGAFAFPPLPPGDYRIDVTPPIYAPPATRVQRAGSWSTTSVTLTAAGPVRDLEVLLHDGFDLSGRIETEPTVSGKRIDPPHSTVTLMRADARQMGGWKVAVSDSRFTVGPIAPGRYRMGIDVDDPWDVSEVLVGGHDMWGQPAVTLEAGSDVTIRMTSSPLAKISGSVSGIANDGCRGHNCWVGLFPVDESQWGTYSRRLPFLIRLTSERTFAFGGLLQGDYYVVVSEPQHVERWPSPDVLKKLVPFATRVTVKRVETPVDLVYRPH